MHLLPCKNVHENAHWYQWQGSATAKPRQVSVLLHPLSVGAAPLLWRDWNRRHHRRVCLRLHGQRLEIQIESALPITPAASPPTLSRAERALSPVVGGAAGPQCTSFNGRADHTHAVRYPRKRGDLARTNHGLTRPRLPLDPFSSDWLASPSRASWPLFLIAPQFSSSPALFVFYPFVSPRFREQGPNSARLLPTR